MPSVVAIQCNIDRGGRYWNRASGEATWRTAREFARQVRRRVPRAEMIGMQEVDSDSTAVKIRELLVEATGKDWTFLWASQGKGDRGDGLAIFWRTDRVSLEKDLGKTPIDYLDDGSVIRCMGGWFRQTETGRTFGFFTTRLAPARQRRGGRAVDDGIQRDEAARVRDWIRRVMLPHPDDPRILAVDLEASFGTRPWFEFHRDFEPDGDKRFTFCSYDALFLGSRHDYLFWDGHGGPRRPGGMVGRAGRSPHFGGTHRFVWAEMKL